MDRIYQEVFYGVQQRLFLRPEGGKIIRAIEFEIVLAVRPLKPVQGFLQKSLDVDIFLLITEKTRFEPL